MASVRAGTIPFRESFLFLMIYVNRVKREADYVNVTNMAKHLGTSKPTLYKRVKQAGLNLDDLRDKDTGELTASGASALAALFDDHTPVLTESRERKPSRVDGDLLAAQQQIEGLRREIELLQKMIDAKDAELARMSVDLEAWRAKAQEVNVHQLLLTMAAAEEPRRRGIWARIRSTFGGKDE